MKVILTPDALADLDHIAEHIEKDNPARAISFVEELREAARRLADLPGAILWCLAMSATVSVAVPIAAMASSTGQKPTVS